MKRFDLSNPYELIGSVNSSCCERDTIARLAVIVFESAARNDIIALEILDAAAQECASMIHAASNSLHMNEAAFPLCFTGGVLASQPNHGNRIIEKLRNLELCPTPINTLSQPVQGALTLANKAVLEDIE